jgi:shikimate kinase
MEIRNRSKRIIFIGYMGSGKTTLGKKVAKRLGVPFIDSDAEIEKNEKASVSEIFETRGQDAFRNLESEYLNQLNTVESFVLSTGGGLPCFNGNMDKLNELGVTIYLERPAKELQQRLLHAKEVRPLLLNKTEDELLSFIELNLKIRSEYYEQAQFKLKRDEQEVKDVIELINRTV